MDQPLGNAIGNSLEVIEAVETLKGRGPEDFQLLVFTLGAYMLIAGGKAKDMAEADKMLHQVIADGSALNKFADFIEAQGGDRDYVYNTDKLVKADISEEILSTKGGYISHIACDEIGICSLILGGGRETKESRIDLAVGLVLHKKKGDFVEIGESLATIHANDKEKLNAAKERFLNAYEFTAEAVIEEPFIKGVLIN